MSTLSILCVTLFFVVLIKCIQWLYKRQEILKKLEDFPGPKTKFLVGNALDFKSSKDVLPNLMQYQKEYGLTYRLLFGPDTFVFTADPKLIEVITTSNTLMEKSGPYKFLAGWIGNGLITAGNPRWKIHRRLITPTFHFNILKDFIPIFHKNADNLVAHWKSKLEHTKRIDIQRDVQACTLDVICETSMGISVNALRDGEQSDYIASIQFMGQNVTERSFSFWKQFDFLYRCSSGYRKEIEMLAYIKNITLEVIKRKRLEAINEHRSATITESENGEDVYEGKQRKAFLDHLMDSLQANGGSMTNEQLREEVDTFIFAGHDTTSSACSFALYFMAMHPDVQEKVYHELVGVLDGDDAITYEKLSRLKYLEMVIKETLRLCPSVPLYLRELTEDVPFDGKILPKGLKLTINAYGTHRNEKIYENPEIFNPERFSSEEISKRGAFDYVPFSAGPRNCIGQKFAMTELKCLLTSLLRHFKFAKPNDFDALIVAEGVITSKNGVVLFVEPRI